MINLQDINKRITDRTESFFWQTDRKISQAETLEIWQDKHRGIDNSALLSVARKETDGLVISINEPKETDQTNLGFINSVRVGNLSSGDECIIRCHPKGIKNGYFYVESLVAKILKSKGLPAYKTYAIHDLENENDTAFQVIEKLSGTALARYLETHPKDAEKIMFEAGKTLAKIHSIKVDGFGSFDNNLAKQGKLVGLQKSLSNFMLCGLKDNLKILVCYNILTKSQAEQILKFYQNNPLLKTDQAVLVHNDYADWNLLTDGKTISGILDLDECCGSDPLCDIACFISMASPDRVPAFLNGYYEKSQKPANFDEKIKLFTLRYVISNMVQRCYRSEYIHTDFLNNLLTQGKTQIKELLEYFNI